MELTRLLRRLREIPPFHVFHREKVGVPLPAEIEHLDQVGVGKGSGETRLAGEEFAKARIVRVARVYHLQGDPLPEPLLSRKPAQVNLRHPSRGDPSQDAVFPEPVRNQLPRLPSSIPGAAGPDVSLRRRPGGELHLEHGAPRRVVPHPHGASVVVRDRAHDGEPQSRPPLPARKIRLEEAVAVPGRDPRPVVRNVDPRLPRRLVVGAR